MRSKPDINSTKSDLSSGIRKDSINFVADCVTLPNSGKAFTNADAELSILHIVYQITVSSADPGQECIMVTRAKG